MGDDITIGVTEIVNNIEVTAQPNDQIVDISVIDNTDEVTLNITPTVIEINVNKGSSFAKWGDILGTLSDQEDLQDALDLKADLVDGKVPSSQLPSYVDDVIEVANYAALPATGESGKIYITIDNNHIFRWTGSIYVEITDNTAVWGAITGTLSSQTDLVTALNLRVPYTGATGDVNLGTYDIKAQKYWMLDEVNSNYGSMHFTDGNYHIEDADGHKLFVIEDGFMQLHKTDTIQSNLYTSNLTAVRDHYLPDASGTLALDENVVHKTGDETISGRKTFNSTTDIGIRSNISGNGYGIYSENSSNGISFYVANNGSGKAFSVSNTLGSFGNMYEGSYNGTSNFVVNYLGEITASKFIKSGGTAFEFLKANGDVDSNIYFKGSVTAGYLPKSLYPSSGDFTTSLIYDSGTKIGIGTTSPVYKFHVNDTSDGIVGHFSGGVSNYTLISFKSNEANVYSTSLGSYNSGLLFRTGATDRMYINSSGNVGIGTTSPAGIWSGSHKALQITGGTNIASELVQSRPSATITRFLSGTAAEFGVYTADALNYTIYTSGSERMRITSSGNIGIGTTSPDNGKLTILKNTSRATESSYGIAIQSNASNVYTELLLGADDTVDCGIIQTAAKNTSFTTKKLALQPQGGNVGIGTTSPVNNLHVQNGSTANTTLMIQSWGTEAAGEFSGIRFKSAATANNEYGKGFIGFRNNGTGYGRGDLYFCTNNLIDTSNASTSDAKMIITSGGNVGIGTSAPAQKLDVVGNIRISNTTPTQEFFSTGNGDVWGSIYSQASGTGSGASLVFSTKRDGNSATDKMIITQGGNVGIGTTSPNSNSNRTTLTLNNNTWGGQLDINVGGTNHAQFGTDNFNSGLSCRIQSQDGIVFNAGGATERMRITSGGVVCIGTTSAFDSGIVCSDGGTSYVPYTAKIGTTASSTQMFFRNPNGVVGSISTSGSLTSFNITSDYRLKQDFKPFNGLDLVSKIKVYDYQWKADNSRMNGVIAHELQEVVPYAVTGEKDAEKMQSVDYSKLVPILVQAIQELKAEIEILKNK